MHYIKHNGETGEHESRSGITREAVDRTAQTTVCTCFNPANNKLHGGEIMRVKQINWSYPSSTNAEKFGFGREGCFTFETSKDGKPPVAHAGFSTLEKAKEFANEGPQAEYSWSNFTL